MLNNFFLIPELGGPCALGGPYTFLPCISYCSDCYIHLFYNLSYVLMTTLITVLKGAASVRGENRQVPCDNCA